MKYLIILALFVAGCSKSNYDNCESNLDKCLIVDSDNLRGFSDQCQKLAACIGGKGEIVHLSNQRTNPYACSVEKQGKTRLKSNYFYPKGEISFGRVSSGGLSNEIASCELATETGEKSDKRYAKLDELFKRIDKDRAERKKREEEFNKPLPPVKVREVK